MAKKARRKIEEQEEAEAFHFPDFDERKFLSHEFEQSIATAVSLAFGVGLAAFSWGIDRAGLPGALPWGLGFLGVVLAPFGVRRLRIRSGEYTKGDWAWLVLTVFFSWLGLWFLFLNLWPAFG